MMKAVIIKTLVNETRTKDAAVTCKELKCAFKVGLIEHKTIQGLRCSPDALGIAVDTDGVERLYVLRLSVGHVYLNCSKN